MADRFLDAHPALRPYVLSNVQLTGTVVGDGAYGSVEEVTIPVCGAAKRVHDVLLGSPVISTQFAEELQLMSNLHHPNIVQFLGVCFLPGSPLPALVMERLLTSLHDLLDPQTGKQTEPGLLSFFKIGLKCSVLHNVASGLAYLHERTPPIIHGDLSAQNVLLTSQLVAKLADLGVARIVPHVRVAATMTKAPGASIYMPPEAFAPYPSNSERSKCDATIDIFSLGVVAVFTLGEAFPCDLLPPTYFDEEKGIVVARTELQRRSRYMQCVKAQLHSCGQLFENHPLIQLINKCLHNSPRKRPNIREVMGLLQEARASLKGEDSERNKRLLIRALQNQPGNQSRAQIIDDIVTENAQLQKQLHVSESEKQMLRQQLTRKEAELTRAEETIRREQQLMRQLETEKDEVVWTKDRELTQAQEQIKQLEAELLQTKDSSWKSVTGEIQQKGN